MGNGSLPKKQRPGVRRRELKELEQRVAQLEEGVVADLSRLSSNDKELSTSIDGLRRLTFSLAYFVQEKLDIGIEEVIAEVERLEALQLEEKDKEGDDQSVIRFLKGEQPTTPSSAGIPEDAIEFTG